MNRKWRLKGYLQDSFIIQYRVFFIWRTVRDENDMIFSVDSINAGREAVIDAKQEQIRIREEIQKRKADKKQFRKQKGQVIKL